MTAVTTETHDATGMRSRAGSILKTTLSGDAEGIEESVNLGLGLTFLGQRVWRNYIVM